MRAVLLATLFIVCAVPAFANARVTVLLDALHVREVLAILRQEGLAYGADLDADMLEGKGGAFWAEQLDRIYDIQRIEETIRRALEAGLDDNDLDRAITYFTSAEGAQIIELENAARQAISDPQVEAIARARHAELSGGDDPLMALIDSYIDVNDLLEWNVSGAMTANYQFFKGLSDGGYYQRPEADILDEVWSQQEDIRVDTASWLGGYLLLAYQPIPLEHLQAYVTYSESSEGQALNAALFEGFEKVYNDISYALGRGISLLADGDEI